MTEAFLRDFRGLKFDEHSVLILRFDESVDTRISWSEVDDVSVSRERLLLTLKDKSEFPIPSEWTAWFGLIQYIPDHYPSFDKQWVTRFFEALTPCEVCGLIALEEAKCLNCSSNKWNPKFGPNIEYLKQEQIEWFEDLPADDPHYLNNPASDGFLPDPNWKLWITAADLKDLDPNPNEQASTNKQRQGYLKR